MKLLNWFNVSFKVSMNSSSPRNYKLYYPGVVDEHVTVKFFKLLYQVCAHM